MRVRTRWLLGITAASAVVVACSSLFEDAVQCTSNADCAGFSGTICGPDRICVAGDPDGGIGNTNGLDSSVSYDEDAALEGIDAAPVRCLPSGTRPTEAIPAEVKANTRLACDKDWSMNGDVIVRAGATLLIDKTVVVHGNAKARLIVQPGARLLAVGSAEEPIVFTGAKGAEFGGVFLLGKASGQVTLAADPLLAYGAATPVPADASGSLKFARIEYAVTGLTLAGVGTGTALDSIQVRQTTDDGFAFFGGTTNAKHLVVQAPGDDAFVFSGNYSGKLQYLVSQRIGPQGDKNAVLVEGGGTRPTIYNATFCGTAEANSAMGLLVRNGAQPNLRSGIVMGYAAGFDQVGDAGANLNIAACALFGQFVDNYAYPEVVVTPEEDAGDAGDAVAPPTPPPPTSPYFDDDNGFDEKAFLSTGARQNTMTNPNIGKCFDPAAPDFAPATAITAPAPTADGFFDTGATYRGAVRDKNDGWTKAAWLSFKAQ